jgi:predicted ATPase
MPPDIPPGPKGPDAPQSTSGSEPDRRPVPKLVGRCAETAIFAEAYNTALKGRGGVILIEGEIGIGKTRLLHEAEAMAKGAGLRALIASCIGGGTPLMSFLNAIESARKEEAQVAVEATIEEVFYIHSDGRLIIHETQRQRPDLGDSELRGLLEEIKKTRRANLKGLFLGERRIIIETGAITILAAVVRGDETTKMRQQMKYLLATLEDRFGETLMGWKGHQADLKGLRENLRALMLGDYGRPEALKLEFEVSSPTVFDDIARFLVASSAQLPLVLLFDDIHWMDPISLQMVAYLAERIEQSRVVVLGTYRLEELSKEQAPSQVLSGKRKIKSLGDLLDGLTNLHGFGLLKLRHLTRDELVEMVSSMYPGGGLNSDFYDFLFRHGEGNPFYTEEILRSLEASGKFNKTSVGWRANELSEMDVPVTIREAVLVRMAGLEKNEREVLQHAAVIGREWDIKILEKILKDPSGLPEVLSALERYNLIVHSCEGKYSFEHDVVRETAYEDISEALRKLYHRRVGEAYEALAGIGPDPKAEVTIPDEILFPLAHHFARTKEKEKSQRYNLMAAEVARKAHDNRRARAFLMTSLEAARGLKSREDVKTSLFDLAKLQELEGDWDQALKDYEELLSMLMPTEDSTKGRVLVRMARIHEWRTEWERSLTLLDKAHNIMSGTDDNIGKALVLSQHARVLRRMANYDQAYAKSEEAFAMLGKQPLADPESADLWLDAMKERGSVLIWRGKLDDALSTFQEARKVAASIGNESMVASLLQNEGWGLQMKGDNENAVKAYGESVDAARRVGNMRTMAYAYANMGEALIALKRFDEAANAIRKALEIFHKVQDRLSIAYTHMIFGLMLTEKGELDDASVHFNMAMELALEVKETTILAQIYQHYGNYYAKKGDPAMARKLLRKSIGLHTESGRTPMIEAVRKDLEKLERGRRGSLSRVTIGRKSEIIKLLQAFKEADQGNGRVIIVEGTTGTGKSKVVEQFLGIAKPQRCLVLQARSTPREKMVPYSPFIEALEAAFSKEMPQGSVESIREVVADNPREMLRMFPMLATLPGIAKLAEGASDARTGLSSIQKEQDRLFENITRMMLSLARSSTVILVLEDFHWADVSSVGLLHYLARGAVKSRLFVLLTYSPDVIMVEGKGTLLTDTLRLMNRERLTTTLALANLNEKETQQMVYMLLDGAPIPIEVYNRIYKETEGNPFFVEEVVLNLMEQGILDLSSKDNVVKKDLKDITLPSTMSQVVERRLQSVSDEERQLLMLAGIIGYRFDYETLRGITGMAEDQLVGLLDGLVDKGLIIEEETAGEESFRFPFDHFRRVATEGLRPSDRIKVHDRIARLLEKRENPEEVAFDLALHHKEAGNLMESARWALIASERARRLSAPELAEDQVKDALAILDQLPGSKEVLFLRAKAYDIYADLCNKTGRYDEADKNIDALVMIATNLDDQKLQAVSFMGKGRVRSGRAQFAEAKEQYLKALELFEKLDDLPNIINARRFLSTIQWRDGNFDEAIANLQGCMEAARKLGDEAVIGALESGIGNVYRDMGDYVKSIAHFLSGIKILEKGLDQYELATAYNNIGATYRYLEKWDQALPYFEKCIALCKKIHFPSIEGYGLKNKGEVLAKMGDPSVLDDAERSCDEAMAIFTKLSHTPGIANVHMNKGIIRRARQDWAGAKTEFDAAIKSGKDSKVPDLLADIHYEYAIALEAMGDAVAAKEQVTRALEIYNKVRAKSRSDKAMKLLSELGGEDQ